MRILLLALMIVLLPLRGWMGDVMALQQTGQAPTASLAAAPGHCPEVQSAHHASAAHDTGVPSVGHDDAHADHDCAGCTVCQICHTVALANTLLPTVAARLPAALAPTPARRYASAERTPGFKPPIS